MIRAVRDRVAKPHILPQRFSAFPFAGPTRPRGVELPFERSELGINYDTAWAREPGARVARRLMQHTLLRAVVETWASPTVRGTDLIAHLQGPVIFVANHHSHLDTGIVLRSLPHRFREKALVGAGADYFFDKKWKAAASALLLNAVPIERKKVSRRSSDQLLALLNDDWNLVIFPEGGRSPDGWGQEFKPGAAFLAIRRGCPVVPIHLEGTGEVLPKGRTMPKRHACTITFGAPLFATDGEAARAFSPRIETAISVLADEQRSTWWQSKQHAAGASTPSLSGPQTASWRREWARTASKPKTPATKNESKRTWP